MRKAVVLAAGRGTRLGNLTQDCPKPMIPLRGRPILAHLLDRLQAAAFTDVFVVTGYRADLIERYFTAHPLRLEFRRQDPINGTATAALLARQFAGADNFLLTYGDVLAPPESYKGILDLLEADREAEAAIGAKDVDDPYQGAAVYEDGGRVTRIVEKPAPGTSPTRWNSAGLYSFRPSIFPLSSSVQLSGRGEYELTSAVEQLIARGSILRLFVIKGPWRDIGRPEDLAWAEEMA